MVLKSSVKNVFIRGSVVRYVHLPAAAVDTALLEDATRRGGFKPVIPTERTMNLTLNFRGSTAGFQSKMTDLSGSE